MQALRRFLPILIALLYIISPVDAIPDFLPGLGWLDDLIVLGILAWVLIARQRGRSPWDVFRGRMGGGWTHRSSGPRPEDLTTDFSTMDMYALLDVSPSASPEEIKAAYKRAVARYHPDKVAHLGKEFQELAHKKLLAIQQAYEILQSKSHRFRPARAGGQGSARACPSPSEAIASMSLILRALEPVSGRPKALHWREVSLYLAGFREPPWHTSPSTLPATASDTPSE
jgi:hypothetical protein